MKKLLFAYSILFLFACSNATTSEDTTNQNVSDNEETTKPSASFFDAKQDFEIVSFEQSIDEDAAASLSEELKATVCEGWSFTADECKTLLSEAKIISSSEWHAYDTFPCIYSGEISQNENVYQYEFNSGDWFVVFNADSSMYLANGEPEIEH